MYHLFVLEDFQDKEMIVDVSENISNIMSSLLINNKFGNSVRYKLKYYQGFNNMNEAIERRQELLITGKYIKNIK